MLVVLTRAFKSQTNSIPNGTPQANDISAKSETNYQNLYHKVPKAHCNLQSTNSDLGIVLMHYSIDNALKLKIGRS